MRMVLEAVAELADRDRLPHRGNRVGDGRATPTALLLNPRTLEAVSGGDHALKISISKSMRARLSGASGCRKPADEIEFSPLGQADALFAALGLPLADGPSRFAIDEVVTAAVRWQAKADFVASVEIPASARPAPAAPPSSTAAAARDTSTRRWRCSTGSRSRGASSEPHGSAPPEGARRPSCASPPQRRRAAARLAGGLAGWLATLCRGASHRTANARRETGGRTKEPLAGPARSDPETQRRVHQVHSRFPVRRRMGCARLAVPCQRDIGSGSSKTARSPVSRCARFTPLAVPVVAVA